MFIQIFSDEAEQFIGKEIGILTLWVSSHVMKSTDDVKDCFYKLGEVIIENVDNDPKVVDDFLDHCKLDGKYKRLGEILSLYAWKYREFGLLELYTSCNPHQGEPMPHITRHLYDEMREEDKKVLDSFSNIVTVYRGTSLKEFEREEYGQSWTLSKEKAEFFAYHYNPLYEGTERVVVSTEIFKDDIFAYVNDREEEECIIDEYIIEEVELISQGLFKG